MLCGLCPHTVRLLVLVMASALATKRHSSVKRPRSDSSPPSFQSPFSANQQHRISSRRAPLASPYTARSPHGSGHAGQAGSSSRGGASRALHLLSSSPPSPADAASSSFSADAGELQCPRCHHFFLHASRLRAHTSKKHRCSPNDHLRSPPGSAGGSSPTSGHSSASSSASSSPTSSAATSPSVRQRRWTRSNRTGHTRFNSDAYSLSVSSASTDTIRLHITPRQSLQRIDPARLTVDYMTHANACLTMKLIHSEHDIAHEFGSFHPTYTHQLFHDEEVVGYKKLNIHMLFTADTLYTHIAVDYEERIPYGADDVLQLLSQRLAPHSYTTSLDEFRTHTTQQWSPPGRLVWSYSIPTVEGGRDVVTYEIWGGGFSDSGVRSYHARIQFFLLLFIDRSSFINDNDMIWEVLLLFEKRTPRTPSSLSSSAAASTSPVPATYSFVGYTTLYKFLHYPSEWLLRLSQILILPPYQRSGHGAQLLQFVYREAERRRFRAVNVEDPAPVFQLLRDVLDVGNCKRGGWYVKGTDERVEGVGMWCVRWDVSYAARVSRALRIPMRQVRRCYEIFKLSQTDTRGANSRAYHEYTVEVKQRLYVEKEEWLCVSASGQERKDLLHELYQQLEQHYLAVIKKARIH